MHIVSVTPVRLLDTGQCASAVHASATCGSLRFRRLKPSLGDLGISTERCYKSTVHVLNLELQ